MTIPATLLFALDRFAHAEQCRGYVDSEATNRMERDLNLRDIEAAIEQYVRERLAQERAATPHPGVRMGDSP